MMHPRITTMALAGALTACYSYRAPPRAPAPGGAARVLYAGPTNVHAARREGGALVLSRVEQLEGYVVSVRGDTVALMLTRTRPSYALPRSPAAPMATVVRGPAVRLEVLRFDPIKTAGYMLGGSALAALVTFVVFWVGMQGTT